VRSDEYYVEGSGDTPIVLMMLRQKVDNPVEHPPRKTVKQARYRKPTTGGWV